MHTQAYMDSMHPLKVRTHLLPPCLRSRDQPMKHPRAEEQHSPPKLQPLDRHLDDDSRHGSIEQLIVTRGGLAILIAPKTMRRALASGACNVPVYITPPERGLTE